MFMPKRRDFIKSVAGIPLVAILPAFTGAAAEALAKQDLRKSICEGPQMKDDDRPAYAIFPRIFDCEIICCYPNIQLTFLPGCEFWNVDLITPKSGIYRFPAGLVEDPRRPYPWPENPEETAKAWDIRFHQWGWTARRLLCNNRTRINRAIDRLYFKTGRPSAWELSAAWERAKRNEQQQTTVSQAAGSGRRDCHSITARGRGNHEAPSRRTR